MLLHILRALCKSPEGTESIWEILEAVVRATGVFGRFAYGILSELHFADMISTHGCHAYKIHNGIRSEPRKEIIDHMRRQLHDSAVPLRLYL
jgi:hypothetical protein